MWLACGRPVGCTLKGKSGRGPVPRELTGAFLSEGFNTLLEPDAGDLMLGLTGDREEGTCFEPGDILVTTYLGDTSPAVSSGSRKRV